MKQKIQFKNLRERKTAWENAKRDRVRILRIKALWEKGRKQIFEPLNRMLGGKKQ